MRIGLRVFICMVWTLAAVVLLGVGCGVGVGGGGGPTEPPPPPSGVTFTPSADAGANTIHLAKGTNNVANRFVLDVRASQVNDLYGVSFDLQYPSALLRWVSGGTGEGSFLGSKGSTELIVEEGGQGVLIVGHSLLGEVEGATGSGTLLSLEFEPITAGSGTLALSRSDAVNSFGDVMTEVKWIGGSVTVSR
jgi:hypothetical protein